MRDKPRLRMGLLIACATLAMGAVACTSTGLKDPATIEGALPSEANDLRVVQAALTVKAANLTIGDQLTAGIITVAEAKRLRDITRQAEEAIATARIALPLQDGTTAQRIAALNVILIKLLQEQIIKNGAK